MASILDIALFLREKEIAHLREKMLTLKTNDYQTDI